MRTWLIKSKLSFNADLFQKSWKIENTAIDVYHTEHDYTGFPSQGFSESSDYSL